MAAELGLPRMFFINKLDRERASFDRTMEQLHDRFGAGVAPLELPIGEESEFRGIADLLTDKAHFYDGPKATIGEIPTDMEAHEHEVRDNLVEGIVVADDDLTERMLEGEDISPKELEEALAKGVAEASVFPVTCGSAAKLIGIDRLAQLICEVRESPLDRPPVTVQAGDGTMDVVPDPGRPNAGRRLPHPGRPLRRQGVLPSCPLRHRPARRRADRFADPCRRASPRAVHHAGQGAGPVVLPAGRRPGGGGQALRHRHRRHARPEGHAGGGAQPTRRRRCCRSPSAPSPRATRTS